jgi:hypothetical protein
MSRKPGKKSQCSKMFFQSKTNGISKFWDLVIKRQGFGLKKISYVRSARTFHLQKMLLLDILDDILLFSFFHFTKES